MKQKVFLYKETDKLLEKIKQEKVVLVGGCFDILHFGHLTFLKKAKLTGNCLVVALESDQFIKIKKGRFPVHNQKQRAKILTSLNFVDYVILLPYLKSDKEYINLVETFKPAVIAISDNDPLINKKKKQAERIGAQVKIVSQLIKKFSTSRIIKILNSYASFSSN